MSATATRPVPFRRVARVIAYTSSPAARNASL